MAEVWLNDEKIGKRLIRVHSSNKFSKEKIREKGIYRYITHKLY